MAKYNTFVVVDTKKRKTLLVTSSARKAAESLVTGIRVEVWSENRKVITIYERTGSALVPYMLMEKQYIQAKQAAAEQRNKRRRAYREYSA